jgi:hypothetical protein
MPTCAWLAQGFFLVLSLPPIRSAVPCAETHSSCSCSPPVVLSRHMCLSLAPTLAHDDDQHCLQSLLPSLAAKVDPSPPLEIRDVSSPLSPPLPVINIFPFSPIALLLYPLLGYCSYLRTVVFPLRRPGLVCINLPALSCFRTLLLR